eukprot:1191423-Prorocentrum_minimum.AAC.1
MEYDNIVSVTEDFSVESPAKDLKVSPPPQPSNPFIQLPLSPGPDGDPTMEYDNIVSVTGDFSVESPAKDLKVSPPPQRSRPFIQLPLSPGPDGDPAGTPTSSSAGSDVNVSYEDKINKVNKLRINSIEVGAPPVLVDSPLFNRNPVVIHFVTSSCLESCDWISFAGQQSYAVN